MKVHVDFKRRADCERLFWFKDHEQEAPSATFNGQDLYHKARDTFCDSVKL